MGPLSFLQKLFAGGGGPGTSSDGGYYVRVQCSACGEIVQSRINRTSELSLDDEGKSYFVRKVLVGQQCYRPIEVEIHFSSIQGPEVSREVKGGTSVN